MALKDLIVDHSKIVEETVEKIIGPYVRYDAEAQKIVLTPRARSLTNDQKVLVFLVAVLGWQYVLAEIPVLATKPADLTRELGLGGGTLRPLLKKLKDLQFLVVVEGHYRAQPANLDSIEAAIAGEMPKAVPRKPSRTKRVEASDETLDPIGEARKRHRRASGQLKAFLTRWVGDGFFNDPKTLANLLERYHEHGVITRQTSLSGLMLEAVRDGLLARSKVEVGGKQVWAYRTRRS